MIYLSIILINSNVELNVEGKNIEVISSDYENIKSSIINAKGKYISFICNEDSVSDNYIDLLYIKCFEEYDTCYINNIVNFDLPKEVKRDDLIEYLSTLKPYLYDYLWSFAFRKTILIEIINFKIDDSFSKKIDEIVKKTTAINEIIYCHYPDYVDDNLGDIPYVDYKYIEYYKNIIYIKNNLVSKFNGIISWCINIGKKFGKKYKITLMYDEIYIETYDLLKEYFELVQRDNIVNYFCDRYISTYLSYEIPRNIFYTEESSVFVTGMMSNNDCLYPDLYDRYIGVSNTCKNTMKLGFKSEIEMEYIHNPIVINKNKVKPHLKLVSTLRSEKEKGLDKLEKIASILDKENIPYTWNVFTDTKEGTNHSGFIYRNCSYDILPYVKDADYLVLISESESYCYSVIESLLLNTKVVVSPLEVFKEIGVVENENAIIIPFELFDDENIDKLTEKVYEIYKNKNKKIKFKNPNLNSDKFGELLKK